MKQENNKQYFVSMWEYVKDSANDFEDANTYGEAEEGAFKIITKKILDDTDFEVIDDYIEENGINYAEVSWNENDGKKHYVPMDDLDAEFFLVIIAEKNDYGYTTWRTLSGNLHNSEDSAQKEIDQYES